MIMASENIMDIQEQYTSTINKMFPKIKKGTLKDYFIQFLLERKWDEGWSQPQAIQYCNEKVKNDGGVEWYSKKGAKKFPDGTPATFGDSGRQLEQYRNECYDGCWDNLTGKKEGPYRLNLEKYNNFTVATKCHSFSQKDKEIIKKRSGGKCELCGYKGKVEIDHFQPKEKNGLSILENANALCGRCNDRKCSKEPTKFMEEEFNRLQKYFTERGMEKEFEKLVKEKINL